MRLGATTSSVSGGPVTAGAFTTISPVTSAAAWLPALGAAALVPSAVTASIASVGSVVADNDRTAAPASAASGAPSGAPVAVAAAISPV